jgi:hypothetical protein
MRIEGKALAEYLLEDIGSMTPRDQVDELTEILARLINELSAVLPKEALGRILGVPTEKVHQGDSGE